MNDNIRTEPRRPSLKTVGGSNASAQAPIGRLLTPREAAAMLRLAESTLAKQRQRGNGPPYILISARRIRYELGALQRWLAARARTRTVQ